MKQHYFDLIKRRLKGMNPQEQVAFLKRCRDAEPLHSTGHRQLQSLLQGVMSKQLTKEIRMDRRTA
jgi:hypothetical protein